jgi:PleD family two-component response regulator
MIIPEEEMTCDKILVVDDDPDELFATVRILKKAAYNTEKALSAKEAIRKTKQFVPDLILLDVVMHDSITRSG